MSSSTCWRSHRNTRFPRSESRLTVKLSFVLPWKTDCLGTPARCGTGNELSASQMVTAITTDRLVAVAHLGATNPPSAPAERSASGYYFSPPVASRTVPEIKEARSEQRKKIVSAISPGSAILPSGMVRIRSSRFFVELSWCNFVSVPVWP